MKRGGEKERGDTRGRHEKEGGLKEGRGQERWREGRRGEKAGKNGRKKG